MSDTPRTDAVVVWTEDVHSQAGIGWSVVAAVHARKLEREADGLRRELVVANEKLAKLAAALREHTVPLLRDCACQRCQTARKALEEAGM